MIGQRWADLCAEMVETWPGRDLAVPDAEREPMRVERVVRIDHEPRIAQIASKRGLQNPDILIFGERGGRPALLAADAKFSVETARSKQVSPAVLEGLLSLEALLRPLLGEVPPGTQFLPGVFLSPSYPLTELMLQGKAGIVRATVEAREVVKLPVEARIFFGRLEGAALMPVLAEVDALPVRLERSVLAALYYFRLARAAIGCWLDSVRPLLGLDERISVDVSAVKDELGSRAARARSALEVITTWDLDVDVVRNQRVAVDQVAGLRIPSRELRRIVEETSEALGETPPSLNQVRRRLNAWHRARLREAVGPLTPPIDNLGDCLQELGKVAASLAPRIEDEAARIVRELIAERSEATDEI